MDREEADNYFYVRFCHMVWVLIFYILYNGMYVFPKWGKYPDSLFNYDQENLVLWMIGCLIIGGLFISVLSNMF